MDPSSPDAAVAPPAADGILAGLGNAFNSLRQVFADGFRLFSVEVRRAGLTFLWMAVLGALAALLLVTAWLGLMGALALWAVSLGITWVSALVAVALANLAAATIVIFSCVALSRNLLFPATQRQLEVSEIPPAPVDNA